MHSAPSVSYPVERSRWAPWFFGVILAASACCVGAWRYQNDSETWRWPLLLGALLVGALAGVFGLQSTMRATRTLRWDGAAWSLSGSPALGAAAAAVALDLQAMLLVSLREAGRPTQWLWLERRAMPERWNALRRALYARAPGPETGGPVSGGGARSSAAAAGRPDSTR